MSHILVAIATPTAPGGVFELVADLARRLGGRITLLHVLAPGGGNPTATLSQGLETLEHLAGRFAESGLECTPLNVEGGSDIAGAILTAADRVDATLIVMGMAGKSSFVRRTGGDIPSQLLSRTRLPVLLLPPAGEGRTV